MVGFFNRMNYFVYILFSPTAHKYYIGQTDNLSNRLERHNAGYEKATKPYIPWQLVWYTTKQSRAEAMQLEKKLKNLSKNRINSFIEKYSGCAGADEA